MTESLELHFAVRTDPFRAQILRQMLTTPEFQKLLTDSLTWTLLGELELIMQPEPDVLEVRMVDSTNTHSSDSG